MLNRIVAFAEDAITPEVEEASFSFKSVLDTVITWCTSTGLKLIIGIILLVVSFIAIKVITKGIGKKIEKSKKLDKTLSKTLMNILKVALQVVVVICLVGYVGIDTSGLAAVVASLGVCVGLAVNGALSNFAGGILIILTRPFKDDDFIEACGYSGIVEDIHIINTKLRTPDNKVVYIPNGTLSASSIVNYSEKDIRRVDFTFGIAYSADYKKAEAIVMDILKNHELALQDPAPMVRISAHNESSIDLVARVWVNSADYWTVHFDVLEQVKTAFDENGIEIPFKQVDVHMR
ncbi:MAG: mechanosensitive ion channel [Clostridia bacterium]|nr:mechanosensitive ion channel [Clostridia bacterium]